MRRTARTFGRSGVLAVAAALASLLIGWVLISAANAAPRTPQQPAATLRIASSTAAFPR